MANSYAPGEFTDKHSLIWAMTGGFVGLWLVVGLVVGFWVRAKTVNEASKSNYC